MRDPAACCFAESDEAAASAAAFKTARSNTQRNLSWDQDRLCRA
jgi:hypothetical protein